MAKAKAGKTRKPRLSKRAMDDAVQLAYENGRRSVIDVFQATCDGQLPLNVLWETMGLNPTKTRIQIVFTNNAQAAMAGVSARTLLCKIGQRDGQGEIVTAEKIAMIAEAYNNRGVAVELNTNGELWTKGE
jgi:hypothetical protein